MWVKFYAFISAEYFHLFKGKGVQRERIPHRVIKAVLKWTKCQTEMSSRVASSCVHPEEEKAELHDFVFVLYRGAWANEVIENTDIDISS